MWFSAMTSCWYLTTRIALTWRSVTCSGDGGGYGRRRRGAGLVAGKTFEAGEQTPATATGTSKAQALPQVQALAKWQPFRGPALGRST